MGCVCVRQDGPLCGEEAQSLAYKCVLLFINPIEQPFSLPSSIHSKPSNPDVFQNILFVTI
jgi:hypothetical protein